uniref:Uncharacterized protein n=1 Tax=Bacillus cereus HuA4-10 TaxID=1053206 RepID=J8DZZ4_BACCE|nr:hypothetical protein IGC_02138 [Bacillus cereus HuA4-10]
MIPKREMNPAIRPCVIERKMRYIMLGPGEQTMLSETIAKASTVLKLNRPPLILHKFLIVHFIMIEEKKD